MYIHKETIEQIDKMNEFTLSEQDVVKINIHKAILAKFIRHKALSLQFKIGTGQLEQALYLKVIWELESIAQDIESIGVVLNRQQEVEKEKLDFVQ